MEVRYLNRNRCYTHPSFIRPQFVVVHSTGAGMKSRQTLWEAWNTKSADKSVHGMADDAGCTLTLPTGFRAWHVGSKGNGLSVGFEVVEPPFIAYADKAHTAVNTARYDPQDPRIRADLNLRFRNALEMAAALCRACGLDADHVLCHAEMSKLGKATAHADVLHWWPLFGADYAMDAFRQGVEDRLKAPPA